LFATAAAALHGAATSTALTTTITTTKTTTTATTTAIAIIGQMVVNNRSACQVFLKIL